MKHYQRRRNRIEMPDCTVIVLINPIKKVYSRERKSGNEIIVIGIF